MSPIDNDVKEVLDIQDEKIEEIKDILDEHGNKIQKLEVTFENYSYITNDKLNNIEKQLAETRNIYLQGSNLTHQVLQNVMTSQNVLVEKITDVSTALINAQINKDKDETKIITNEKNNNTKIIDRLLIVGGTVAGYFLGKNN